MDPQWQLLSEFGIRGLASWSVPGAGDQRGLEDKSVAQVQFLSMVSYSWQVLDI
jgi:hypothetical protein